jgi:hypothetical protein
MLINPEHPLHGNRVEVDSTRDVRKRGENRISGSSSFDHCPHTSQHASFVVEDPMNDF